MKPSDTYITKDGRELIAVDSPRNRCATSGFICCLHGDEECSDNLPPNDAPCRNYPILFVNKEEYLAHKLLGTKQSSS